MALGTWLAIGEAAWVLVLATWIVTERRSPPATLAWIFALAWIPLLGIPVYLLIGPRRLRRKKLRYRRGKARIVEASPPVGRAPAQTLQGEFAALSNHPLARLNRRAGGSWPRRASRVEMFWTGDDCYRSMEAAIAGARDHVHLEYYIWEPDRIGTRFRDLLCEKAKSGVEVRVLVDAIGSSGLGRRFFRPLRESGAEVAWFNPISVMRLPPNPFNFRTHRKLCLIDGATGYLGGVNLCDNHSAALTGDLAWRDTHVRIEGAPVGELQLAFLEDWQFANGRGPHAARYFPEASEADGGPFVQILASGPDHDSYCIERFFFGAIGEAKRRVLITTPYFVPNDGILAALTTAAMRGVGIQILVPKTSDSRLVAIAARSYLEELARHGVRIWEYGPPMLHAKTMVVDDDISLVGTANMDNRSFRLNFEIAAVFFDPPIASLLATSFESDLRRSSPYRLREALRAPFVQRLAESTARLLSPLL
jgi:cardiolipin synthase